MPFPRTWAMAIIATVVAATPLVGTAPGPVGAAPSSHLMRSPYLTDLVGSSVTVNWATDRSAGANSIGYVKWGTSCASLGSTTAASLRTPLSIGYGSASALGYQWKAVVNFGAPGTYCYRVYTRNDTPVVPEVDLLGTDASPLVTTQVPADSSEPLSFAVLGDWGEVNAEGANPHLDAIMQQIKDSGARFTLTTGDNAYNNGSQEDYGDLQQPSGVPSTCTPPVTPCPAVGMSAVFGPSHWAVPGRTVPLFAGIGNHGLVRNDAFHPHLQNWPQDTAVATSGGRYAIDTISTPYVSNVTLPSLWYAFQAGPARVYMLETAWPDNNNGSAPGFEPDYANDYEAHWKPGAAEYDWLKADLEAHPGGVKLAVFHKPLYSVNATERSDIYLRNDGPAGSRSLETLLSRNGVRIAFNGHAHDYQRNRANGADSLATYVTGGGGADLAPVPSTCATAADPVARSVAAYALGWSPATNRGSICGLDRGSTPAPTAMRHIHHFLKVTVNRNRVTVAPTDETGAQFDVQTYTVTGNPFGHLGSAAPVAGRIRVRGWALDPDRTRPIQVQVTVNGVVAGTGTAKTSRPDIVGRYPAWGPDHGFDFTVPGSGGRVCAEAINTGPGTSNTTIGCTTLPPSRVNPVGNLEVATRVPGGIRVAGWALVPDSVATIKVHVYVNGAFAGLGTADRSRPDVGAAFPGFGNDHGFDFTVPGSGGTVCVYAINTGPGTSNSTIGCRTLPALVKPVGNLDSATRDPGGIRVAGWALDPDRAGAIMVRVYVNGAFAGMGTADRSRPDVGAAFPGYGSNHGFAFNVPGSRGTVCAYAMNTRRGAGKTIIGCRAV